MSTSLPHYFIGVFSVYIMMRVPCCQGLLKFNPAGNQCQIAKKCLWDTSLAAYMWEYSCDKSRGALWNSNFSIFKDCQSSPSNLGRRKYISVAQNCYRYLELASAITEQKYTWECSQSVDIWMPKARFHSQCTREVTDERSEGCDLGLRYSDFSTYNA